MLKNKKKIFLLLILINLTKSNIICDESSTRTKCNLISVTLKKDFIFEFPILEKNEAYEITGKISEINCENPCKKIIIKSPKDYKSEIIINLTDTKIKAQIILIDIKGNLTLKNSEISSSNKSTKFTNGFENCLSLTGYCYFYNKIKKDKIFNPTSIESNNYSIYYFQEYLKNGDYEKLGDFLGISKIMEENGGGQITINVDYVFIEDSFFDSSFKWEDSESLNRLKIVNHGFENDLKNNTNKRYNYNHNPEKGIKKKNFEKNNHKKKILKIVKRIRLKKNYFGNKIIENEKTLKIAGTGGFIFLNIKTLEIKNDKTKFRADVLGSCYEDKDDIIKTSSSSGFILAKIDKAFEIKENEKNTIDLYDLLQNLNANKNCFTSSTGFVYLENEERNILASIYDVKKNFLKIHEKENKNENRIKKVNLKKDIFNKFENNKQYNKIFKDIKLEKKKSKNKPQSVNKNIKNDNNMSMIIFKISNEFILDKIFIKNLSLNMQFNTENNLNFEIKKLEINNSNETIISVLTTKNITFEEISLTNTNLKIFNLLIILKKNLNLYISTLIINRFFSNESEIILENSLIQNFIDKDSENLKKPDNFDNLKDFTYIKKNFEEIKHYNFISIQKSKKIYLTNSKIQFPIIILNSEKIQIETSKLISQFRKKAIVKIQNNACGYPGSNNAGLGFFSFKTKNNFCIKDWIIKNKSLIQKNENSKINFSSSPIFISKKDFIKDDVFVNIGGYIDLNGGELLFNGFILAEGQDSSNIEHIYIGSSSGGNIVLEFGKYQIKKKSVFSVSGGKGSHPLGPSGGGKFFIFFKPSEDLENYENFFGKIFGFKKNNFKDDDEIKIYDKLLPEFFDKGENSFKNANSYDFPNPIFSFYNQNKNLFLGKIYNSYECEPGYYSPLCQKCPFNKFKPFFGHGDCIDCPCEIEKSIFYKVIIDAKDCPCKNKPFIQSYFLEILLFFGFFTVFIIYTFHMIKISKNENDHRLMFSIGDISNLKYRIFCNGSNIASNPFYLKNKDLFFITNSQIFCEKFNKVCLYNKFEKFILYFFYFLNFSPLFFLIESAMKISKINNIKYLLKTFLFLSNDYSVYIIKYNLSANASNFSIIFLNNLEKLKSHEFAIKYPFKIPIIGMGLFHYQLKLDLKDPVNVIIIKNLKRNIKNENFDLSKIIPGQLIKFENDKKYHILDYLLSYLNVLLSTLQIDIPKIKLIMRIKRFENFIKEFNNYLAGYGFNIIFFINFSNKNKNLHFKFFSLFNSPQNNIKKIIYILKENKKFSPKLYFEIIRTKRTQSISIIFPLTKENKNTKKQKNSQISQSNEKLENLKSIKIPKTKNYFIFKKIRKLINTIFWTFFTYHNCIRKKFPYYLLKFIFLIILLTFKIYTSKSITFDEYLYIMIFYPCFIDEITIVLLILQIFINKKKLDKFIIYCSFLSFCKSLVITVFLMFYMYLKYNNLSNFIFFYFFYSFVCLLLCYFNCYEISFELFDKTILIIEKIN